MSLTRFAVTDSASDQFAVYETREQAEALIDELERHFPMHRSVSGLAVAEVPVGMPLRPFPPSALRLLQTAKDQRHNVRLIAGQDTGRNAYFTIETGADADGHAVRVTWHTRVTPTYRLFSCLIGSDDRPHDGTLTAAIAQLSVSRGRR